MSTSFDPTQVARWLAAFCTVAPVTPETFEQAMAELVEVQRLLDETHATLARRPSLQPEARGLLDQLVARRRSLLEALGEQVVAWRRAGGAVVLGRGEAAADPTPGSHDAPETPLPPEASPHAPEAAQPAEAVEPLAPAEPATPEAPLTAVPTPAAPPTAAIGMLAAFLQLAGPPRDLDSPAAVADEVSGIEALADTMDRWPKLPKPTQRLLLGMLVARARATKEAPSLSPGMRARVQRVLTLLPPYAKANVLGGHVNGLGAAHSPQSVSWRADASALWDLLWREVRGPAA